MSATAIPRDPGAWRPSNHFAERFKDLYSDEPPRHLSGDIVDGCISDGEISAAPTQSGVYFLEQDFDGVRYRLVVAEREGLVLTGYPVAIDVDEAKAAIRWTPREISDIAAHIEADIDYDDP